MALPELATLSDLSARGVDTSDASRAQAALTDVSALIRMETAPEDWVDSSGDLEDVPDAVVAICCRVTARMLAHGDTDVVASESLGSWSTRYRDTSADVLLTAGEREALRRIAGVSLGLGSIRLRSPWAAVDAIDDGDADTIMVFSDEDDASGS